ncbi:MAG: DUF1127 domain-containing protein [Rhodospirillaceae bacterium]
MRTMTQTCTVPAVILPAISRQAADAVTRVFPIMVAWQKRVDDRRRLRDMTDAQLRDLGLTRGQIAAAAAKPFWVA